MLCIFIIRLENFIIQKNKEANKLTQRPQVYRKPTPVFKKDTKFDALRTKLEENIMWFWALSAIAGSILGSATDSWFRDTKLGVWFYAKWIRSILGHRKDMGSNCSQMRKNEWQNSQNSPNDLQISKLVSEYSTGKKLSDEELMNVRTRYNTWEKDGREVDF